MIFCMMNILIEHQALAAQTKPNVKDHPFKAETCCQFNDGSLSFAFLRQNHFIQLDSIALRNTSPPGLTPSGRRSEQSPRRKPQIDPSKLTAYCFFMFSVIFLREMEGNFESLLSLLLLMCFVCLMQHQRSLFRKKLMICTGGCSF